MSEEWVRAEVLESHKRWAEADRNELRAAKRQMKRDNDSLVHQNLELRRRLGKPPVPPFRQAVREEWEGLWFERETRWAGEQQRMVLELQSTIRQLEEEARRVKALLVWGRRNRYERDAIATHLRRAAVRCRNALPKFLAWHEKVGQ